MIRLLFFILLFLPSLAWGQYHNSAIETYFGYKPENTIAGTVVTGFGLDQADGGDGDDCTSINGAGTGASDDIIAFSLQPSAAKTLDKFRFYASAKNGTLGANDIAAELMAAAAGVPSGSPGTTCNTISTAAAASTWIEFTCFTGSDSLTANVQRFIRVRNCNASAASNNISAQRGSHFGNRINPGRATGWGMRCTTDAGTGWTQCDDENVVPMIAVYGDGTVEGEPWATITTANAAANGNRVYNDGSDDREVGSEFTTPPDAKLRAIGLIMHVAKIGTPTGNLRYRLYEGTTLIATTGTAAIADVSTTAGWVKLYFSSVQTLNANTQYEILASSDASGGSTSNSYGVTVMAMDLNATGGAEESESLLLRPAGGTMHLTVFDDTTRTDTETSIAPAALILDNSDYFGTQSGGGRRAPRSLSGGGQ